MPRDIRPFVSTMEGDVFCVHSLPEEIIASLFGKYSRSNKPLRVEMVSYLDESQEADVGEPMRFDLSSAKASKFHATYTLGYGHKSLADNAMVHVAVENCSMVAEKYIEDARLGGFIAKSTRYVLFDPEQAPPVDRWGVAPEQQGRVRSVFQSEMRNYQMMLGKTKARIFQVASGARDPGMSDADWDKLVSAKAFDMCRGLLPFGASTSLGITMNARELAHTIQKWDESYVTEMRLLAGEVRTQALKVVPTLLRYSESKGYQRDTEALVRQACGYPTTDSPYSELPDFMVEWETRVRPMAKSQLMGLTVSGHSNVPSDSSNPALLKDIVRFILDEFKLQVPPKLDGAMAEAMCSAYVQNHTLHQQPGRALEAVTLRGLASMDIGAWRDMQRHRMMTQVIPDFRVGCGFYHPFLEDPLLSGQQDLIDLYTDMVESTFRSLFMDDGALMRESYTPYVLPLCTMIQWPFVANLRQCIYMTERRSVSEGHPSYRQVARDLGNELIYRFPFLKPSLKLDDNDYPFARQKAVTKTA